MSTPIRRIVYSKLLSPVSRSPKTPINNQIRTPTKRTSARFLNFETPTTNAYLKKSSNYSNVSQEIYLKVPDYTKVIINTPNKRILLNSGISDIKDVTILGKGAFGTVISGIYKDCRVAAKIVKLSKDKCEPGEKNVINLNHKNIIKIIDVIFEIGKNYSIVLMEHFCQCRHLQSIIDDSTVNLDFRKIIKYGLDIGIGLDYCHLNKILHLDLKPSNILVCDNNLCKLCDFGNSQNLDNLNKENFIGTIMYAAPELLMGKRPTTKCDVYSLGIVLWQMRHRKLPFSNLDRMEVIVYKVVKYNYRPELPEQEIKDAYYAVYVSCWLAEPNNRPETNEIVHKLKMIFV